MKGPVLRLRAFLRWTVVSSRGFTAFLAVCPIPQNREVSKPALTVSVLLALALQLSGQTRQPRARGDFAVVTPRVAEPAITRLGEPDWRFAHANAQVLAGINVERLLTSTFAKALFRLLLPPVTFDTLMSSLGEVDQIAISIQGSDVLAMLVGRMQQPPPGINAQNLVFRRVGPDAMLIGVETAITSATRRLSAPPIALNGTRLHQAKLFGQTAAIWLTGSPAGFRQPAAGIENLAVALYAGEDLRAEVAMKATTLAQAQQMFDKVQRAPATMGQVSSSRDGRDVRMTLALSRAEAEKSVAQWMSGPQGKQLSQLMALLPAANAIQGAGKALQPESNKVVIYGLDGGPKEIPLPSPTQR